MTTTATATSARTAISSRKGSRRRRALATTAGSVVLAMGLGGVAIACGDSEPEPCPAREIQRVWDGGASHHPSCENLTDWFDHLFYPGHALSTAQRHTYQEEVTVVQLRLRDLGHRPIAVDGLYGSQTKGAVKRYQDRHDLPETGIVGARTWKKLFGLGPA